MPNCYEILNQIAARSGLDRTVGHPLYSYRVTPQELDILRHELTAIFKSRGSLRTAEECGAFCCLAQSGFAETIGVVPGVGTLSWTRSASVETEGRIPSSPSQTMLNVA